MRTSTPSSGIVRWYTGIKHWESYNKNGRERNNSYGNKEIFEKAA